MRQLQRGGLPRRIALCSRAGPGRRRISSACMLLQWHACSPGGASAAKRHSTAAQRTSKGAGQAVGKVGALRVAHRAAAPAGIGASDVLKQRIKRHLFRCRREAPEQTRAHAPAGVGGGARGQLSSPPPPRAQAAAPRCLPPHSSSGHGAPSSAPDADDSSLCQRRCGSQQLLLAHAKPQHARGTADCRRRLRRRRLQHLHLRLPAPHALRNLRRAAQHRVAGLSGHGRRGPGQPASPAMRHDSRRCPGQRPCVTRASSRPPAAAAGSPACGTPARSGPAAARGK